MARPASMMAFGATLAGSAVAQVRPMEENNIQCLLFNGNGCSTINDKDACLNSRDGRFFQSYYGRQIRGEPCVWCPDGCEPKEENGGNKCEPYQWVVGNTNLPVTSNWVGANCLDGRDIKETVERVPGYVYSSGDPEGDWVAVNGGENQACRGASAMDAGNFGADYTYSIWSAANLEACKAFCKGWCMGVEYRAADRYCEVWWTAITTSTEMSGYQCHRRDGVVAVPLQMPQGASGPPEMLALPQPTDGASAGIVAVGATAGAAASGVAGAAGAAMNNAAEAAAPAAGALGDVSRGIVGGVADATGSAADAATQAMGSATDAATQTMGAATDAANSALEAAGAFGQSAGDAANAAGDAAGAAGASVGDAANAAAGAAGAVGAAAGDAANAANEAGVSAMNAANEAAGNVADAANAAGEAAGDAANAAGAAANDAAGAAADAAGAAGAAAGDAANAAGAAVSDAGVSAMNAANDIAGGAADAANAAGAAAMDAANHAGDAADHAAGAATDAANCAMAGAADAMNGAGAAAANTMNAAAGAVGESAAGVMAAATGILPQSAESPPAITNAGEIAQRASDGAGTYAAGDAAVEATNEATGAFAGAFGAAAVVEKPAEDATGDAASAAADAANQAAEAANQATGAASDAAGAAADAANQAAGAAADAANQATGALGDAAGAAADAANQAAGVAADAANQATGAAGEAAGAAADAAGEAANAAGAAAEGAVTAVANALTGADDVPGPEGHPDNSVAEWPAPREAKSGEAGGRFVRGDQVSEEGQPGEIFWQDAFGKHTLPEGVNCAECGCDGQNVQTIAQAELNAMPAGDTFHCVAMNPAAPTMFPGGRFVVVEEEVPAAGAEGAAAAADAGTAAAEAAPMDGAVGAKQVYWQSPTGEMHAVPAGYDCSKCGCNNPMRVADTTVKAAVNGAEFNCDMMAGLPVLLVPEVAATAREAVNFVAPAGETAEGDRNVAAATPTENLLHWGLVTVCVLLLAGIVFYCHGALHRTKKGKITRAVGMCDHDDDANDEEAGASPKRGRSARKIKNVQRSDGDEGAEGSAGYSYAAGMAAPLIASPAPGVRGIPVGFTNQAAHADAPLSAGSGVTYMPPAVAYSPQRAVGVQMAVARPQEPTVFDQIDRNHDGVISREEWQRYAFDAFDSDRNGVVSAQEWQVGRQRP